MSRRLLFSVRGVVKAFAGVQALADVNLDVMGGEVHALIGENGAGKSTLMKILFGVYKHDAGDIIIEGRPNAAVADPTRRAGERHRPRQPGASDRAAARRRAEYLPGTDRRPVLDASAPSGRPRGKFWIRLRPRFARDSKGRRPWHGRSSDRGDRPRTRPRRPHHRLRRADLKPHPGRAGRTIRHHSRPQARRQGDHLHLPPNVREFKQSPIASPFSATGASSLPAGRPNSPRGNSTT